MKNFLILTLFLFLLFQNPPYSYPANSAEQNKNENWVVCQLPRYGVKFSCDPDWRSEQVDEDATMYTISEEPFVTLTLSKVAVQVVYLEQMTKEMILDQNLYLDNFQKDRVPFGGREAIELKAFSKIEPDMRFQGYYYIYQSQLYDAFFAVYPKEQWDNYKFLIKKIVGSFQIL